MLILESLTLENFGSFKTERTFLFEEGINIIETAINTNAQIQLIIELSNAKTTNGKGTTYKQIIKCSDFKVPLPKDGKLVSNFTAERIGLATIVAAS